MAQCKKYLDSLPNCYYRKRHGDIHNPGEPDLTICINGQRYEVELKKPGSEQPSKADPYEKLSATPLQAAELHRWERSGAIVGVANSVEQLKEIIGRKRS